MDPRAPSTPCRSSTAGATLRFASSLRPLFNDYDAKYLRNDTQYFCPSGLSKPAEEHLAALGLAAFAAVGAEGWGRADFMMDAMVRPQLLEVNTVPGMTDHTASCPWLPRPLASDFDELVWRILEYSFTRVPMSRGGA